MRLKDKVALVTGGSRGIGRAISTALAREGAVVIINYKEDDQSAQQLVKNITGNNGKAFNIKGDVRDKKQVNHIVKNILERFGHIDILVNNAGVVKESLLFETEDRDWDLVIDTNLKGVYNCIKAIIKPMMLQGRGKIINISSFLAERPWKGHSVYSASKGAINSFTKAVAVELAPKDINVNAVAPGFILTDMSRHIQEKYEDVLQKTIPMRRCGIPAEVASLVVFLSSDEANYITGKIFGVDGGII